MIDMDNIFQKIQAWLYPNRLKNVDGSYIARVNTNRIMTDNDICTIMKTRLEIPIRYEDLLNCISQYNDEILYQLYNGNGVTTGLFTAAVTIGGTFDSVNEAHDHNKHRVNIRFIPRARLRRLARNSTVEVLGIAGAAGYIDTFTDLDEDSVNGLYVPGNQVAIHGSKIEVCGADPGVGVFFVPVDNPSGAVKMPRLGIHQPSLITGIAPHTGSQFNRIEVRTQFSGVNGRYLKALRTLTSAFVLEEI
jgi:hypothetical protein